MRTRRKSQPDSDKPPMSAMIDVVFLLLIFFIVTQRDVISEAHLQVNLPTGGGPSDKILALIDVRVMPNAYYYKGKEQSIDYIAAKLKENFVICPDAKVDIKTKLDAKHKKIVAILDACKASGLKSFNLQTLK